ncbi:hypothetical protein SASPL_150800 [Salvia splendens]|uniref:DUF7880 domain-containing protein n=1 Tax=Salvia splendens TaxID=180675 RepID=A0A8X8W6Q6_SALSN|nr:uncharacterized protein LOC121782281 [Salvia splendens]KAG6389332.1 hypothetical protein SASPL_150800 [Salvia splendens]
MTTATGIIAAAAHARFALIPGLSRAARSKRCTISTGVRCALPPQAQRMIESRRSVSLSLVFLHFFCLSKDALAANAMDKYVKKKRLDPLEAYIPAVILTEFQIKELGQYLEDDQPQFLSCRNLLRSGPASSLRVNIRAVAQYASDAGNGKYAFDEVDQCLRALEELDSLLLRASRNDSGSSVEAMKARVVTALNALNSLLKTVPDEVLDKGKAMANAYMNPGEDTSTETLDPQLKKLESIL